MRAAIFVLCAAAAGAQQEKKPEAAASAAESPLTSSFDVGYRSLLTRTGSFDVFRSVVNLGAGPKLFGGDLRITPPSAKLFDEASLTLRNWGGEPNSTLMGEIRKANWYRLDADYRDFAHFNFLPSFANPRLNSSAAPDSYAANQNAFDTRLRSAAVHLELAPAARVAPFFSYSRNTERGAGVWLFSTQGNEYAVPALHDYRGGAYSGGAALRFGKWTATLEQGVSTFEDNQSSDEALANAGNLRRPFLGRTLSLNRLVEQYRVHGDSLYSRASMAAALARWLDLNAAFTFANPETTITYENASSGALVTPGTLLDAGGGADRLSGAANALRPSGSFRAEFRPARRWRLVQSFRTDHFENTASAQLLERYLTGAVPREFARSSTDRLRVEDNRQEVDAFATLTRSLTFRAGYRYQWGSATVRSSQFLAEPLTAGELNRHSGVAGLQYRKGPVRAGADVERGSAGQVYFRNSLRDYAKVRARASYTPAEAWRASFEYQWLHNDGAGGGWDFETHSTSASVEWLPKAAKSFSLLTSYARSAAESNIAIFEPRTLLRERSSFREAGHSGSLFVRLEPRIWGSRAPGLQAGGTFHVNTGSRPTSYYAPRARLALPFFREVTAYAEWRWFGLTQSLYSFENFGSHQFTAGLSFTGNRPAAKAGR